MSMEANQLFLPPKKFSFSLITFQFLYISIVKKLLLKILNYWKALQIAAQINKTFCRVFYNSSISLRKATKGKSSGLIFLSQLVVTRHTEWFSEYIQVQDKRRIGELRSEHTEHVCTAQCTRVIIHHHHDHHNSIVFPPEPPPAYCFYCIRNAQKQKIMTIHRFFS